MTSKSFWRVEPATDKKLGKRPVDCEAEVEVPVCSLEPAKPPVTVASPLAFCHEANEFTLPETSKVQSPAGMIMPAFAAVAESAKTAPAAVFY